MHYIEDPTGLLQIVWEPPTLFSDKLAIGSQNVSIDSRITHFIIYITVNESTTVYNASGTSFDFENDNSSCSLSFQVAAVNPAGVGELSPLQTIDSEFTACHGTLPVIRLVYDVMHAYRVYGFHKFSYSHRSCSTIQWIIR